MQELPSRFTWTELVDFERTSRGVNYSDTDPADLTHIEVIGELTSGAALYQFVAAGFAVEENVGVISETDEGKPSEVVAEEAPVVELETPTEGAPVEDQNPLVEAQSPAAEVTDDGTSDGSVDDLLKQANE